MTDVEGALRRETRQRRLAERVVQGQSDALARTLQLLAREPALPDFIRALLRAITAQCGGVWTTFWTADEQTGEGRRAFSQWRDAETGRSVEAFAAQHPLLMRRLAYLYRDLIHAQEVTQLVPIEDPRVPLVVRRFYRKIGATGALLVPLRVGKKLLGWISHQRGDEGLLSEQVAFLESMAQQAALAFHLTRLSEAQHEAASARRGEQLAREREQELSAISRLLHVNAQNSTDRLSSVLCGAIENITELLHGRWASLWRGNDAIGSVTPSWVGAVGKCTRVPASEGFEMAAACRKSHRARLEKWQSAREMLSVKIAPARLRDLLAILGAPPAVPGARLVNVPLCFDDELLGFMLVLTENLPEKTSERCVAVKALAVQAALALTLDEMSAVQRAAALAEERNRIARDLHDLLAQSFTGIALQVEAMRVECPELPSGVAGRLEKIRAQASRSAEELRRTLMMLRPTALDQCTLAEALVILARETQARTGVRVLFENGAEGLPFAPRVEQHVFAIVSEALQNALEHAAPTEISISFELHRQRLTLSVVNDGQMPAEPMSVDVDRRGHGLRNIRDRTAEIGGRFVLRTLDRQIRLEVTIPVGKLTAPGVI